MIMIAILHEVLLMVILPMLLPLIKTNKDWFSRHPEFGGTFVRNTLQSKVLRSATTSSLLQYSEYNPTLMPKILLLTIDMLESCWSLSKKKSFCHIFQAYNFCHTRESWFSTPCHNSSDTICYKNNNFEFPKGFPTFWAKKENYYSLLLFTCHYSPVLFTVTVHSEILPI